MYLPVGGVDSICLVRMASVFVVLTRHRASPQGTFPRWLHTETMPFHRASFPGGSTDEALCYNLSVTTPKAYQQPNTREPPPPSTSSPQVSAQKPSMTQAEPVSRHVLGTTHTKPAQPYESGIRNAPRMSSLSFPAAWSGLEPSHSYSLAPTSLLRTHTALALNLLANYLSIYTMSTSSIVLFPCDRACHSLHHPLTAMLSLSFHTKTNSLHPLMHEHLLGHQQTTIA